MKIMGKATARPSRGFTLIELLVVIGIIAILLAITGPLAKPWLDKYRAESQIRTMHADLLQARTLAMQKNKEYFVKINSGNYQIIEDTNENGAIDASPTDTYGELKPLTYAVSATGSVAVPLTITIDTRGIISAAGLVESAWLRFDTRSTQPEFDCLQLYPTRISVGRMDETSCVPR